METTIRIEQSHRHIMEGRLLEPRPLKGLLLRFAAWYSRKLLGRVITPITVLYTRNSALLFFSQKIERIFNSKIRLSETEKLLIKLAVSLQNGCSFCGDIALAKAFQQKLSREKFSDLVMGNTTGGSFTNREEVLLRFVRERMEGALQTDTIGDLKVQFSEEEIVDIGWAIAAECYYNQLSITFGIESDGLALAAQ
jgi:AhpD family alkylhydroperoxidase